MDTIGQNKQIGSTESLGQKSLKSSIAEQSKGSYFHNPDFLAIDKHIEDKYGSSQGLHLCWLPAKKFQESFDGRVEGYSPVVKDEKDRQSTSVFANALGDKSALVNNFFIKENLILAQIPIDLYNERREHELQQSRERRALGANPEAGNKIYDDVSLKKVAKGVKNETLFKEQVISGLKNNSDKV